jgi:hypothetical protein
VNVKISHVKTVGDPAFRFNIFSESMQDYLFSDDRAEDDTTIVNVLDSSRLRVLSGVLPI